MIVGYITLVTIIVIVLFAVPILVIAIKLNIFKSLTLKLLIKVLNRAFVIQLILAVILGIIELLMDKAIYSSSYDRGNGFSDLIMETAHTYLVIGSFIYFPNLVVLNIINWVKIKLNKAN